jgi:hypothetical protein
MAEGIVDFVVNPSLADRIPEATQRELQGLSERIRRREFVVPRGDF